MSMELEVTIDNNSGFCFGVVYAIEMAEDILEQEGALYCLGDIVHNDMEVARLTKKGLKIINHEDLKTITKAKVLIRAHGEPASTYEMAMNNEIELIDASCPVVLKLQHRIKNSYDKKVPIYIYGKHGHAEVIGLLAQTGDDAVVFQSFDELDVPNLPKQIVLYSQTTKSTESFYNIKGKLEEAGIEVLLNDTICRQVSNRDKQLRNFSLEHDRIVFVAGPKSSNGKVLYNVCKNTNPKTHFISKREQLQKEWFNEAESIGICGATSTPAWLMEDVKEAILQF